MFLIHNFKGQKMFTTSDFLSYSFSNQVVNISIFSLKYTLTDNKITKTWRTMPILTWVQYVQNRLMGLVGRVFANGPADLGSILGRVIPKTFKMVLDTSLLNTQLYKVCIKGKVEQSRERSSTLPGISV